MNQREGTEERKHYWKRRSDSRSHYLLIAFSIMIIIMLIVVISMGAYGYYSWQEWRSGPKIKVEEGLFDFNRPTGNETNITVHLRIVNEGEKRSGDIEFEWLVMDSARSEDNVFISNGAALIEPIDTSEDKELEFNITLPVGHYVLAYRVYDDGLFSYEARQPLEVRSSDIEPGDTSTETVPEFPSLIIPVLLVIVIFILYRKRYHGRKNGR